MPGEMRGRPMTAAPSVPLAGSERLPLPGAQPAGPVDPAERIQLTLVTRRAAPLPQGAGGVPVRLSRADLQQQYGSDPADHELVARVLGSLQPAIDVTARDPGTRRMTIAGPASALAEAFGTELTLVSSLGPGGEPVTHRYRSGSLHIPAELDGIVEAVLGLDSRPQARPHFRFADPAATAVTYTPAQIASLYQFPAGTDGTGQTV